MKSQRLEMGEWLGDFCLLGKFSKPELVLSIIYLTSVEGIAICPVLSISTFWVIFGSSLSFIPHIQTISKFYWICLQNIVYFTFSHLSHISTFCAVIWATTICHLNWFQVIPVPAPRQSSSCSSQNFLLKYIMLFPTYSLSVASQLKILNPHQILQGCTIFGFYLTFQLHHIS